MPAPASWFEQGINHIWLPYAQMKTMPKPSPVASTLGTRIKLPDGNELIDGVGSWWTAVHGYGHPVLIDAAEHQLKTMPHIMLGGLAHEQAYKLAARLASITPGDLNRTFLSESGSVAVEVAMKIAVQYWRNQNGESRSKFVSFNGGYHGDTFATMSVCDPDEGMHSLFAGALADQHVVDIPDTDDKLQYLRSILTDDRSVAAVLIEPLIQGAGGMRMHSTETLKSIRSLCDEAGVLLIFDEIFTGFGRTGSMFAAAAAGVVPDIMTLGKALTGGITPLAATIASERVYQAFHDDEASFALMHGPTFTGHAIGCAVANASIDIFDVEPRLLQVAKISEVFESDLISLKNLSCVQDVRICGAVAAVEFSVEFNIDWARQWFIDHGVFIRPLGRVVYLTPAFTIEPDDLNRLTAMIREFADTLHRVARISSRPQRHGPPFYLMVIDKSRLGAKSTRGGMSTSAKKMEISDLDPSFRSAYSRFPKFVLDKTWSRRLMKFFLSLSYRSKRDNAVHFSVHELPSCKIRVYQPRDVCSGAAIIWIHGGGLVLGKAAMNDDLCNQYSKEFGATVVSVDYRLAPSFPFPAAINDCFDSWKWLLQNAPTYNVDPARIAICGQSAGGGLAAALCHRIRDENAGRPAAQCLFYPMLDDRTAANPELDPVDHIGWNNRNNRYGWGAYLGSEPGSKEPPKNWAVPARRSDLRGLPPTWVGVGDLDLFLSENKDYASRLSQSNVECVFELVEGAPHGFDAFVPGAPLSKVFQKSAKAFLAEKLQTSTKPMSVKGA